MSSHILYIFIPYISSCIIYLLIHFIFFLYSYIVLSSMRYFQSASQYTIVLNNPNNPVNPITCLNINTVYSNHKNERTFPTVQHRQLISVNITYSYRHYLFLPTLPIPTYITYSYLLRKCQFWMF